MKKNLNEISHAKTIIARAEKELGPLSDGECRDLLLDQGIANIWPDAKRLVNAVRHSRAGRRAIAKNPTLKKRRIARANLTETAYIYRPSQITRKKPVKRLVKRRVRNLKAPKGVFPNPMKSHGLMTLKVQCFKNGKWVTEALFMETPKNLQIAKSLADELAKNYKTSARVMDSKK